MSNINDLSPAGRSAAMRGGMEGWGVMGSGQHIRYMEPKPSKSRRRCRCGCERRATHYGRANGVTLMNGCELSVRRWVKEGSNRD